MINSYALNKQGKLETKNVLFMKIPKYKLPLYVVLHLRKECMLETNNFLFFLILIELQTKHLLPTITNLEKYEKNKNFEM